MSWDDEDAELLLRAGDSPSTVARLLGMDIERVESIAAERSRAKLEPEERQRIGEIRRELRGEKPEPEAEPKPPKAPPAATKPTRKAELRAAAMSDVARERELELAQIEVERLRASERTLAGEMGTLGAERDEARAETERINVLLTKEQDLRWAERKDADEKIERLESSTNQAYAERDEARAKLVNKERELHVVRMQFTESNIEIERLRETLKDAGEIYNREASALAMREQAKADISRITAERDTAKAEVAHWMGIAKDYESELIKDLNDQLVASHQMQQEAEHSAARHIARSLESGREIERLKAELAAERRESATNQKAGIDLANQIGAERDEAQREVERLRARAEAAESEVRRLAAEVRGLADLAASLRGLAADVRAMEQTYPGACESCGCPTSRTRLLVEQRDKYSKQSDDARRALESYQPDWEELAARRAGTWIEPKESK